MFLNCENDKKRSFISGFLQILVVAILVSSILSGCDKEDLPWYQKKVIEDLTPQGQPNVSFDHCTLTDANIDTLVFGLH
ncbi:MAG: hypothetical protein KDB98_10865, partial [Flavobacteriales bacterium]|nr:hypothetical protein [Flavobacteriales bacterium]